MADVLSSGQFIASNSVNVRVCEEGIKRGIEMIMNTWNTDTDGSYDDPFEPNHLTDKEILEWIFLQDTLNFCFWSESNANIYTVDYKGKEWTGYYSLCACLSRAVQEGMLIYKPSVYGNLSLDQMQHIFRSSNGTTMPLLKERLNNLHEAARIINEDYDGDISRLVTAANRSAQSLINLLADKFPSYRDVATYKGRKICFLKRAQIFISKTWGRFNGKGYGQFDDIHSLTMFADYRVPQSLVYVGALKYSDALQHKIDEGVLIDLYSEEEIEIRGCTIWAVELIRKGLSEKSHDKHLLSCQIDHFLWRYAKAYCNKMPHHKTLTIFY